MSPFKCYPVSIFFKERSRAHAKVDELINWVFSDKPLWFYDGIKYRLVIHFKDIENGGIIYYFDDDGQIINYQFGGES